MWHPPLCYTTDRTVGGRHSLSICGGIFRDSSATTFEYCVENLVYLECFSC